MSIGALIIGDEILSGKREDKHFAKVVELLKARGMALDWAQYLGDDRARLTEILRRSFATDDIVSSSTGPNTSATTRRASLPRSGARSRRTTSSFPSAASASRRTTTRARPPPRRWARASPSIPMPNARFAKDSAQRPRRNA